ncbi:hypothetical protein BH10PAT3_BH10PAT3_5730 [soil metagenome]
MIKTNDDKHQLQYAICVSGAAGGDTVKLSSGLAERTGAAIAKKGHILTTGATVGLPYYAARGAKLAGGVSIGFSPASSIREHLHKYRLPHIFFDFINFTGLNYVGRDQYLVQSSDAVITIGGRIGSLHEFVTAINAGKPCGILLGSGGAADIIPQLVQMIEIPHRSLIVYDDDPEVLVDMIIKILDAESKDIRAEVLRDEQWFLEPTDHSG